MRPRIAGATARRLDAIADVDDGDDGDDGDDRLVARVRAGVEAVVDHTADLSDIGSGDVDESITDDEQVRPRLSDEVSETLAARQRDGEHITDTLDRLIVGDIVDLAAKIDRTPTARQAIADEDTPGVSTYQALFGTWNDALEAAGFDPNHEHEGPLTDDELLDDLRAFADEIGDTPSSTQMAERGPHSTSTYITRFGTWADALEAAGLEPRGRGAPGRVRIPDEDLLDELRSLAADHGEPPSTTVMDDEGAYSSDTYKRRFGSWTEAIEAAGLDAEWTCTFCGEEFGSIGNRDTHERACDREYGQPRAESPAEVE